MACMIQFLLTPNPKGPKSFGVVAYFAAVESMLLSSVTHAHLSKSWGAALAAALSPVDAAAEEGECRIVDDSVDDEIVGSDVKALAANLGYMIAVLDLAARGGIHIGGVNPVQGLVYPDGHIPELGVPLMQYARQAASRCHESWAGEGVGPRLYLKAQFETYASQNVDALFGAVHE